MFAGRKGKVNALAVMFKPTATLLTMLILSGCGPEGLGSDWHRVNPPADAPDFALPQLDGTTLRLVDLQGKVVVMDFWATWCGPCRSALPSLEAMYRKYRDRGVVVLLINQGETPEQITKWASQRYTAPILLDAGQVGGLYRVRGIPQMFIVNQEGKVVYLHGGYGGGLERSLKLVFEELLAAGASVHG